MTESIANTVRHRTRRFKIIPGAAFPLHRIDRNETRGET